MTLRAEFMPEAAAKLAEAWRWYEDREPGLGDEFVRAVRAVVGRVQREPEFYPAVLDDVRQGLVRRFPYGVFYAVRGTTLVVFAVYHSRRDPQGWQDRAASDSA